MGDVPGGASQPPRNYPVSPLPAVGSTQSKPSTPHISEPQETSDQYHDPQTSQAQHGSQPTYGVPSQQPSNNPFPGRDTLPSASPISLASLQTSRSQSQITRRGPTFNMASLSAALQPDTANYGQAFGQQAPQGYPSVQSQPGFVYQPQQVTQFTGQIHPGQSINSPYNIQYTHQYQGKYALPSSTPVLQQDSQGPGQQFIANQNFLPPAPQHQPSAYFYQPTQYPPSGQVFQTSPEQPYGLQYGLQTSISSEARYSNQQRVNENQREQSRQGSGLLGRAGNIPSTGSQSSTLRGPPRKPKQTGHALWVGNLPSGAKVVDLKDHFSRDATNNILSVFLISKSNCAFVNYRTEESCAAAMSRFHDSRFKGVRLVCRLRRGSANVGSRVPTGPSAASSSRAAIAQPVVERQNVTQEPQTWNIDEEDSVAPTPAKEKFFIVKSLTVEDLELSVRNGVWATQSHNEQTLNKAFENSDNVYLVFSANKSGEYFGYARMVSSINDDPAAAIEFAPNAQIVEDPDLPKAIQTPATEFAPKGRIIDDSARGTIFWEADVDQVDGGVENEEQHSDQSDQETEENSPTKAWGKPFKIEWLSTNRLPFYRTRGLRNPWNSNREVKIARDGTELETTVGQRLIQMFHREASPTVPNMPVSQMMDGYPPMRPY